MTRPTQVNDERQAVDALYSMTGRFTAAEFAAALNREQRQDPADDGYVHVDEQTARRVLKLMCDRLPPVERDGLDHYRRTD